MERPLKTVASGFLLNRRFVDLKPVTSPLLKIASWNILADQLHDAFPKVEKKFLVWEHRRELILKELRHFVENGFIIFCAEVDHFDEMKDFVKDIAHAVFKRKEDAKNPDKDGVAMFLPSAVYDLEEFNGFSLIEGHSHVCLICRVRNKETNSHFALCGTHLKAKVGNEDMREKQAQKIVELMKDSKTDFQIVLGDFNDVPNSKAYNVLKSNGYHSAYAKFCESGVEPYTTSKIRAEKTTRCIDYIFYTDQIEPVALLQMPDESVLEPTHLPLEEYPSDHLSVAVKFSVKQ